MGAGEATTNRAPVSSRTITFAGYGLILLLAIGWAIITARRDDAMTLPAAVHALTRTRTARILVVIAWAWLGWHLFARGSGAFK